RSVGQLGISANSVYVQHEAMIYGSSDGGETWQQIGYDSMVSGSPEQIALDWSAVPQATFNNRLVKSIGGVSYTPGSPGVPASPGRPAAPTRTVYEPVTVCDFVVDEGAALAFGWTKVFVPYDPATQT